MSDVFCKLCGGSDQISVSYSGEMRNSGQYEKFKQGPKIYECGKCRTEFIDLEKFQIELNYDGGYWGDKKGVATAESFKKAHDKALVEAEQWRTKLNRNLFTGRSVMDFGAGTGAFLEVISETASATYAIEADPMMRAKLSKHHAKVYEGLEDAICDGLQVDIVVCFDVLEHLTEPLSYVERIGTILRTGGIFVIGVPNKDDYYKELVGNYKRQFYHLEHLWYYSLDSLKLIASSSGYTTLDFGYLHKYTFLNFINWLSLGRPTGNPPAPSNLQNFDGRFRQWLEEEGASSHVFIVMQRNKGE